MNKTVSKLLGLLLLFCMCAGFVIISIPPYIDISMYVLFSILIIGFGFVYSLLHQEQYPIQLVLMVLAVDFILYKMFSSSIDRLNTLGFLLSVNVIFGLVFSIIGSRISKAFSFVLAPIQSYLSSIGIKFSIPVISGILGLIIGYILLKTEIAYIISPLPV